VGPRAGAGKLEGDAADQRGIKRIPDGERIRRLASSSPDGGSGLRGWSGTG
jgi:hypothetical protein